MKSPREKKKKKRLSYYNKRLSDGKHKIITHTVDTPSALMIMSDNLFHLCFCMASIAQAIATINKMILTAVNITFQTNFNQLFCIFFFSINKKKLCLKYSTHGLSVCLNMTGCLPCLHEIMANFNKILPCFNTRKVSMMNYIEPRLVAHFDRGRVSHLIGL